MDLDRRDFMRLVGQAAAGGAALASGAALVGCAERKGRPRSADEAKAAVARAVFGPELAAKGQRIMASISLSGEARDQLESLLKKARQGVELDEGVIHDHEDAVKRLLRALWTDEAQLWLAVGFPHGPGQCTVFDLYTRPPDEAARNETPFPRGRKRARAESDDGEG